MKVKINVIINVIIMILSLLLSIHCYNDRKSANSMNENKPNFHIEFTKLDTIQARKYWGATESLLPSDLSSLYIVEFQNIGFDSLFIPCRYVRQVPIYSSKQATYFGSLNDTIPINVSLPFDSEPANQVRIMQDEKKYFLTSLTLNQSIAKIDYSFYFYVNGKKKQQQFKTVLTKQNNEVINMTTY